MRSRSCWRHVGKGARQIGKGAIVAAAVERGEQAPSLGRDACRHIDRRQPDQADQEAQTQIFEPVAQVA